MRGLAIALITASLLACGKANDEGDIIVVEPGGDPPAAPVWKPATEGSLAGETPSAEGSCPQGTTLVAVTTLPHGLPGEMDVCLLDAPGDLDVVTLTNDNIYRIAAIGDDAGAIAGSNAHAFLRIEAGTLVVRTDSETTVLGAEADARIIVPPFDVRAEGTDANPVVVTSQASFAAWLAQAERMYGE